MLRQLIILLCATFVFCQSNSPSASEVNSLAKTSPDALASSESKNETSQLKQSGFVPLSRTDITSIEERFSLPENSFQNVPVPPATYLPAERPLEDRSANVNNVPVPAPVEPVIADDASSSTSITTSEQGFGQSSGQSTFYAASVLSGPKDSQTGAANVNKPVSEKPYKAVPLSKNTETIPSQETSGQSSATYKSQQIGPTKTDTIPSTSDTVTIESHKEENKESSEKSDYPVHHHQTVISPPTIQYIHSPTYAVNPHVPVGSKTVSLETFDSVTALPSFRYTPAPSYIRFGSTPVPVIDPIPVPVLYENLGVETFHHSSSQFAAGSEPIPVPVLSESSIRYNPIPSHVVHAKSFVESVYTPVGSYHHAIDHSPHRYEGYARALSYSPASSVSSVSFNGLGVNYGW